MRDSTKWMMGALAAVGAVLVAGLQLGSIGRLDLHNVGVVVSILLVALAVLGIGWLIYLASRVLASEYTNLNDAIRDSEKLGKVLPRDWVERDVPRAKTRGMRSLQQISEERDQRYKELSDQPDDELERELEIFDQMVEDAVVVVNHRVAKRTYARLRRWASCVAPLVVLAVVVFALMSGPRGRSVGDPQIMQVVPSDSDRQRYAAVLGTACIGEPIPAAVVPRPSYWPTWAPDRWTNLAWPFRWPFRSTSLMRPFRWFERNRIAALPSARCRGQPRTFTLDRSLRTAAAGGAARPALASFLKPARALQFRLFQPWKEGTAPQAGEVEFGYGFPGDRPLVGDWNHDGTDTIGVHHAKSFYLRSDNTPGGADIVFAYGRPGDTPLVGDWNGDGTDTIGVHRGNRFLLRNSNTPGPPDLVVKFGAPGDTPLVGDWNGDRKDTIGVRVRHSNRFRLRNTNTNTPGRPDLVVEFGKPGGTPLVGDWGGDGKDTIGVRRDGLFYLTTLRPDSKAFSRTHNVRFFRYGQAGDQPLVGDWDADGADDIGVRQGIRECLLKDGACGQQAWQPRTGGVELRSVCALEWPRTPRGHPAVSREQRCVALGLNYEPDPRVRHRSSSRF